LSGFREPPAPTNLPKQGTSHAAAVRPLEDLQELLAWGPPEWVAERAKATLRSKAAVAERGKATLRSKAAVVERSLRAVLALPKQAECRTRAG